MIGLGLAAGLVLLVIIIILIYNGLVRKRVDTDNAWSQIDVQLRRRYDLIPNMVETVKGYAAHERETLDAVISARAKAVAVSSDAAHAAEKAGAENMLTAALGRLIAVAEAYPQLKADRNFAGLQEELSSTENKISFARQHFNDTVARYETSRQSFPSSIVAGAFGFRKREYFELEDQKIREAPKVAF
jgi:LemA protein